MNRNTTSLMEDEGIVLTKSNWSKQNIPKSQRLESKYSSRLHLGDLKFDSHGKGIGVSINKQMQSHIANAEHSIHESRNIRSKDKKDRATTDMVLDQRTKLVLYSMINMNLIHTIYGCISTGKEANVYYAIDSGGQEFAVKIYKTSILSFKDRRRYVKGEHRFERGYSKNPRKMVAMWAEKEFRNLKRLQECGIPAPIPIYVRQNVLLMKFISKYSNVQTRNSNTNDESDKVSIAGLNSEAMIPAPRLKDIKWDKLASGQDFGKGIIKNKELTMPQLISDEANENESGNISDSDNENEAKLCKDKEMIDGKESEKCKDSEELIYKCYIDCIRYMRLLYWKCRLIHCDLSEYNLLYDNNNVLYLIDVSQSVEPSHPESYSLLAMDCKNVNEYFRKQHIGTLTHKELFDYIIDDSHISHDGNNNNNNNNLWKDIKHKEKIHFHPRNDSNNNKDKKPIKYGKKIVKKVKNEIQKEIETNLSKENESINNDSKEEDSKQSQSCEFDENRLENDIKNENENENERENEAGNVINEEKLVELRQLCESRFESMSDLTKQEHLDNIDLSVSIPHNLFEIDDEFYADRSNAIFARIQNLTLNEDNNKNENENENDINEDDTQSDNDSNDRNDDMNEENENSDNDVGCVNATTRVSFPMIPAAELQANKTEMSKEELKELRKKNKQLVKEANKERRKHKLPKHVKKRKIKVAKQKAGKTVWKG